MPLPPGHDEVHVFLVRPDEALARLSVGLWLTLDREERARARAYPAGTRAEWFVAVHALLRSTLGEAVGAPPRMLRMGRTSSGKPFLAAPERRELCFSLSRTAQLGAIAIARRREVGIDVEDLRTVEGAAELARRRLPPRDVEELARVSPGQLSREFLRLWTRSESRLKAIGAGLDGAAPADHAPLADEEEAQPRWRTVDLALGDGQVGAVTIERGARVRIVAWRAEAAPGEPGQFRFTRTELTANAT